MSDRSALHTFAEIRHELDALWGRLNATREQLLHQLRERCKRIEESSIHVLQGFAVRLRHYV